MVSISSALVFSTTVIKEEYRRYQEKGYLTVSDLALDRPGNMNSYSH